MQTRYILALDQGTTSSRAIVFGTDGSVRGKASRPLRQIYPAPGWVEHDPMEILEGQISAAREAIARADVPPGAIAALGITNQRETTILWERATGKPIGGAIVWQCRRTADICAALRAEGREQMVRAKTGLLLDPYFSATKIAWLLSKTPGLRTRAERGEILFGTVDTWLIYNLTGGTLHVTDPSNAARTLLYNIHAREWDEELLDLFRVPRAMLPEVRPSSGDFGVASEEFFGAPVPIRGVAGDQQAALFGQGCLSEGGVKNTYGTGCFLLMHTGAHPVASAHGLVTTVAWEIAGETEYALEGSVFAAGAAVQWLRDELGLLTDAVDSERLAQSVTDTGGVYLVPAFSGLGAPHWDASARGAVLGLTRGSGRAHLVRAALESIAYQTEDVLQAMRSDTGMDIPLLRVDGGAAVNDFLLQFQADVSGTPVVRGEATETTALGAALLAGLGSGVYRDRWEVQGIVRPERLFEPRMAEEERRRLLHGWHRAVERSRGWTVEP